MSKISAESAVPATPVAHAACSHDCPYFCGIGGDATFYLTVVEVRKAEARA